MFEFDAGENPKWTMDEGKWKVPALGLYGEFGPFAQDMESISSEIYDYVTDIVPESGP